MYITKNQKEILMAVSVFIVLFIVFWIFIYIPANLSFGILKTELLRVKNTINALEAITGKERSMEAGYLMLQKQFEKLDKKFPENEKGALQLLSNTAYEVGVSIVSTKTQPKTPFLDKNEKLIKIGNKVCHKMPLSMVLHSDYRKLVHFLEGIRRDIPHLLTIETVKIIKEAKQEELKIDILLTMYFLAEERE